MKYTTSAALLSTLDSVLSQCLIMMLVVFQFRNQYDNDVTVWSPQVSASFALAPSEVCERGVCSWSACGLCSGAHSSDRVRDGGRQTGFGHRRAQVSLSRRARGAQGTAQVHYTRQWGSRELRVTVWCAFACRELSPSWPPIRRRSCTWTVMWAFPSQGWRRTPGSSGKSHASLVLKWDL